MKKGEKSKTKPKQKWFKDMEREKVLERETKDNVEEFSQVILSENIPELKKYIPQNHKC